VDGANVWGLVYGIASGAFMRWMLLPAVEPVMQARVALTPVGWFGAHLLCGGMLCLTPLLGRNCARHASHAVERWRHTLVRGGPLGATRWRRLR
jgi:hypothetical protein